MDFWGPRQLWLEGPTAGMGCDDCQFALGLCYRPLHEPVRTGLDVELMPEDDETVRTEGPDEARLSGLAGAEDQDIKI